MNHYCAEYDDNCEGCQPAIADAGTGLTLPQHSPEMVAVRAFWKTVALEDKRACHRVWCHNSRDDIDMESAYRIAQGMEVAFRNMGN